MHTSFLKLSVVASLAAAVPLLHDRAVSSVDEAAADKFDVNNSPIATGTCTGSPGIIFATGLDGRTESAFEPADKTQYPHTSAQNMNIIMQFICDSFNNICDASSTFQDCKALQSSVQAKFGEAPKVGAAADQWNAGFGLSTNFGALDAVDSQGQIVSAGSSQASPIDSSNTGDDSAVADTPDSASDFGKCSASNVEIGFGKSSDRPNEDAFFLVDTASFNHGSALNIGVLTSFITQQLADNCKAFGDIVDIAKKAAISAGAQTGQAAADAWNSAFGLQTSAGLTDNAASTTSAAAVAPSVTASATNDSLLTFDGALGGQTAPAITAGGRGFIVNGDSFLNLETALQRACDIQKNLCANTANAGGADFTVSDCEKQHTSCLAE